MKLLLFFGLVQCAWICLKNSSNVILEDESPALESPIKELPEICSICLETFPLKERFYNKRMHRNEFHFIDLPILQFKESQHSFHRKCIEAYQRTSGPKKSHLCPLCRQPENNTGPNEQLFWYAVSEELQVELEKNLERIVSRATSNGLERALVECSNSCRWERLKKIIGAFGQEQRKRFLMPILGKIVGDSGSGGFSMEMVDLKEENVAKVLVQFLTFEESMELLVNNLKSKVIESETEEISALLKRKAFDFLIQKHKSYQRASELLIYKEALSEICWKQFTETKSDSNLYAFLNYENNAALYSHIFSSDLIDKELKLPLYQRIKSYFEIQKKHQFLKKIHLNIPQEYWKSPPPAKKRAKK